ncbi:MAG: hypothetical protein JW730_19020 [Anaerolineales bacterium]|nr:hypothetical protein [Anaerolineales bacterium]
MIQLTILHINDLHGRVSQLSRMMTEQSFSLIPFPTPNLPEITITGTIARQNGVLALQYSLAGKIGDVFLPPPSARPIRKNELWKTTCFEFFPCPGSRS